MAEGWQETFTASLSSSAFDKGGNLQLTFTVTPEDKYTAMPITDIRGRQFTLNVSTVSKRVFAGKEGIEEARRRVQARKEARATLPHLSLEDDCDGI